MMLFGLDLAGHWPWLMIAGLFILFVGFARADAQAEHDRLTEDDSETGARKARRSSDHLKQQD